ncbi:orotidine-5'-phosphate decarboxylase [Acidaminobacter sp. JC074]|uniref:orotidine-5'-phosphate decarboxylase n=1 Tax=Acidaminobacter sp. JC074 TaxID=2530199 RepID=UPI001F0DE674|nr:orotidine-5'-phosphate decarboxylase [Acidaminobacter sp. JC074]MCH4890532.1 orotidine-5'-phosphate decarboxylase [Acidaminobacter sp. JC074]
MSINKLVKNIIEKQSPIVVGLDPRIEQIPEEVKNKYFEKYGNSLEAVKHSFIEFNRGIIDAVEDLVPAVKPQIAFYEKYGIEGLIAYKDACDYAKEKGLHVIADIKRGDIGSTSKAYSDAHIGLTDINGEKVSAFFSDSVTVNPYLGDDCLKEFVDNIETYDKGMWVLVKTSNKSSEQLQNLLVDDETIYKRVGDLVNAWSEKTVQSCGYSPIGAVVGATFPQEAELLRKVMPKSYFLVPGYGAQGASGKDIVNCFNEDGLGAIVNSSRGIIFAYLKKDMAYKAAARQAVVEMKEDINSALVAAGKKYF